jgi:hypothetical protein
MRMQKVVVRTRADGNVEALEIRVSPVRPHMDIVCARLHGFNIGVIPVETRADDVGVQVCRHADIEVVQKRADDIDVQACRRF